MAGISTPSTLCTMPRKKGTAGGRRRPFWAVLARFGVVLDPFRALPRTTPHPPVFLHRGTPRKETPPRCLVFHPISGLGKIPFNLWCIVPPRDHQEMMSRLVANGPCSQRLCSLWSSAIQLRRASQSLEQTKGVQYVFCPRSATEQPFPPLLLSSPSSSRLVLDTGWVL